MREPLSSSVLGPKRSEFDLPRDVVWLNAAQMSVSHRDVIGAGRVGVMRKQAPWNSPPSAFFTEVETARGLFARVIGATPDDVAICPSCSYGVATAAQNIDIKAGDRIILVAEQFPSNVYAWRRLAQERGATVVTVERDAADAIGEPLIEEIRKGAALVACAPAHWSDGTPIGVEAVAKAAREAGAALVLDMTQSAGALPIDIRAIDPDFAVFPMYKWLLGPYSTGFFYAAPRRQAGRPLEEAWVNRKDAEDFAGLVNYTDAYAVGARRYDMGQKANFTMTPMMIAALKLVLSWKPKRIAEALAAINARLSDALAERGFDIPEERLRSPHFFGVRLPAHAPADLAARMAADRVYVSVRGAKMRISPHLWIDDEDEARFLSVLDKHLG